MTLTKVTPIVNSDSQHTGGDQWNELVDINTAPRPPAKWIVYKAGTTYKVMNNENQTFPYSGDNLKTNVWDNIKNDPLVGNVIFFKSASTPYDVPNASSLDVPSTARDYSIYGESPHSTIIRPLSNTIAFVVTNMRKFIIDGLQFYTDLGTTYTTDMVRIVASNGGCEHITLRNLKLRMDAGTSTITQAGRGIVFLLANADPSISWVDASYITIQGFTNALKLATFTVTGTPWSNENSFFRVNSQHSKGYFQAPPFAATEQMWSWHFRDCGWQTTAVDATSDHMFDLDVAGTNLGLCRGWHINNCAMWDAPTNTKFLMANSNCRILIEGGGAYPSSNSDALGDEWMGGTGWDATNGKWNTGAYVERISSTGIQRGVSVQNGDGSTTVFNIPHRLLRTPKIFDAKPRSTDAGNYNSYTQTATATNIVLTYGSAPPTGTGNLTWQWEAREYV